MGVERRYDGKADAIDSYEGRISRSKEGIYKTSRALMITRARGRLTVGENPRRGTPARTSAGENRGKEGPRRSQSRWTRSGNQDARATRRRKQARSE